MTEEPTTLAEELDDEQECDWCGGTGEVVKTAHGRQGLVPCPDCSDDEGDTTITCDECNTPVRLTREDDHTLSLRCECPEERSIKVASALPAGWSE